MNSTSDEQRRESAQSKITLSGAVSMGTAVMIGAGVFELMGQ